MSTAFVSFYADINAHTVEHLVGNINKLIGEGATEVHLLLSTPGGDPADALGAYNVLRSLPVKLITHNVGRVASAANTVFLAGEVRYATPLSSFHYHRVLYDLRDHAKVDRHQLRELLDMMLSDHSAIVAVIVDRTHLEIDEIERMLQAGTVIDANAALGAGVIHEVREAVIPEGARLVQLAFRRPGT